MSQGSASGALAGLNLFAGATPLFLINDIVDTAGFVLTNQYTVPAGKVAVITSMVIQQRGGTAYTFLGYIAKIADAGTEAILLQAVPSGQLTIHWEGQFWMAATDTIGSYMNDGDTTSDYRSVISGVEFDA